MEVIITLGSNIDKEHNLSNGIAYLEQHQALKVKSVSNIYETVAVDQNGRPSSQPSFYNAAALVETDLTPQQLRRELRKIEGRMGRVRTADKFAPRTIDLDIAMVGSTVVTIDGKKIPEEESLKHPHVVLPLADVAPDWDHPLAGVKLGQIVADLDINEMEIIRL